LQIDCILFDSDGTLVDSLKLIVSAYNYAVEPALHETFGDEQVASLFGPPMEKIFSTVLPAKFANNAVLRYHEYYREHFLDYAKTYPGVPELVTSLYDSNQKLGVVTGAGRMAAELTLKLSGLSTYFKTVVTGDDVNRPKPDPDGLQLAIRKLSAIPDRTIYIGDSGVDIRAAKNAGTKSAGALWGSQRPTELVKLNPDFVFHKPSDVLESLSL
jgi:HAD superfamily hydrolase (TIGR01509 family)